MKTFLILLVGVILGVLGYQYYQRTQHPTLAQRTGDVVDTTKEKAGELKDKVVEQSRTVGERVDDARIITAIKGKYVIDKDLSVLAISVSCTDGKVVLTGTVDSDALVAKAAKLARETSGVVGVSNRLTVRN
jgi:osmotically-inducible protein OsmY